MRIRPLATWLGVSVLSFIAAIGASAARGEDALIFVSSFASGKDGGIVAYKFDTNEGTLKQANRNGDVENAFFLALSPQGEYLYSIHAPEGFGGEKHEQVAAFKVMGKEGELKLLNTQSSKGTASCYLDVDNTGKTLVVANYSTGSVASYPINRDGSLKEAASFIQHAGGSVNKDRQEGPHAHSIVISPDNRFVFAADLGLDQILVYDLDAKTSMLSPHRQPFVRTQPGAGPRHFTFDPSGKHAYVINELLNTVTLFDYDAAAGILIEKQNISTIPDSFKGATYTADLKITPNGKFLYGTNRGHDSIACYKIDDQGRLTLIGIEPSLGMGPQNLAITSDGKWLLCANMPGNSVAVFQINQESGEIKPKGNPVMQTGPSCIMIMP